MLLSTWIRFGARSTAYVPIAQYGDALQLRTHGDARVRIELPGGGRVVTHEIMGTLDSWYHLLIEIQDGVARLFVNGLPAGDAPGVEPQPSDWLVHPGAAGNAWDIGDTAIWFENAPDRNVVFDQLVFGPPLQPAQFIGSEFKASLEPAVKVIAAELNRSGLLTLEFSHTANRGSGADEFPWPVAWRGRGAKICHAPTGLQVGDTITIPARFIEVEATGEFNGKTTIQVTAAEELSDLPLPDPAERIALAGNASPGRYFSNVFRYGNDLQRLSDWKVLGSGFQEDAELDPVTGIPVGDAEHHWNFTDRKEAEAYSVQWKGSGKLELSHGNQQPVETGLTADGWHFAVYPAGHAGRLRKIGEVTAMRGQWLSLMLDIDKGSTSEARDLWAPFSCIRHMGSMGTNSSTIVNPEDLVGPEFVGQRNECNIPALCRLTNEIGVQSAWFCVPHAATDACVRRMFELIRDNLDPGIAVYIEYTNEAWNYGGAYAPQTRYVRDLDKSKTIDENYARRSVEVETIGIDVLGDRYAKTILAGQFAVPSKANVRYAHALNYGLQRGAISNAVYFSPDILDEDPATWTALKAMSGSQLMDLTKYSLEEDLINFEAVRQFCSLNGVECLAYEGGWSYSNRKVNAGNFEYVGRVALEGARHPKQVEVHHYAYTLAQQHGFTLAMQLAPEKGGWDLLPQKFKTWSDYEAWDQQPGTEPGESPRGLAPILWRND